MSGSGWLKILSVVWCLLASAGCQMLGANAWPEPTLDVLADKLAADGWQVNRDNSVLDLVDAAGRQHSTDHAESRWTYHIRPQPETKVDQKTKPSRDSKSKPKPEPWTKLSPPNEKQKLATDSRDSKDAKPDDTQPNPVGPSLPESSSAESSPRESAPTEAFWSGMEDLTVTEFLDALDDRMRTDSSNREHVTAVSQLALQELATRNDLVGWNAAIHLARRFPEAAADIAPTLKWIALEQPAFEAVSGQFVDDGQVKPQSQPFAFRPREKFAAARRWLDEKRGKQSPTTPLATTKPSHVSAAMQTAAIEAWCLTLSKTDPDIRIALTPAGRVLQETYLPTHVRGELFRSLAWWLPPDEIPYLARALEDRDDKPQAPREVRRAAIDACLIHTVSRRVRPSSLPESTVPDSQQAFDPFLWPTTVENCRWDADAHVRKSFARWIGLSRHQRGFPLLTLQLTDTDPRVRENAMISLGYLGTAEARVKLQQQAAMPQERVRAFAIRGLSHFGPEAVVPFLSDTSYVVREAVVEELAKHPSSATALRMRTLLTDKSLPVQLTVVSAVSEWPNSLAIPLLLHGMRESSRATRKKCFDRIRKRTPLTTGYRFDASRSERNMMIGRLIADANLSTSFIDGLRETGLRRELSNKNSLHSREIEEQLRQLSVAPKNSPLATQLLEQLCHSDRSDAYIIERFLEKHLTGQFRETVLREVLPELSEAHRSLKMLVDSDVRIRRRAAASLARESEKLSLSSTTLRELRTILVHEQDRLVWQYVMKAAKRDATEEGAQLALLAINSTWPDIRRLGCEYILLHPRQEYALWLIPLFYDDHLDVQYVAVEAAGKCRNPGVLRKPPQSGDLLTPGGLRSLLASSDRELRFRTAVALTLLGDVAGEEELLRMSYEPNAKIRTQAVQAMAETGRTRFRDHLIRTAWTEKNDLVRRAIFKSLETLTPRDERPVGLDQAKNDYGRAEQWIAWRKKRQAFTRQNTTRQSTNQQPEPPR
jgi:HEAT repeat protein